MPLGLRKTFFVSLLRCQHVWMMQTSIDPSVLWIAKENKHWGFSLDKCSPVGVIGPHYSSQVEQEMHCDERCVILCGNDQASFHFSLQQRQRWNSSETICSFSPFSLQSFEALFPSAKSQADRFSASVSPFLQSAGRHSVKSTCAGISHRSRCGLTLGLLTKELFRQFLLNVLIVTLILEMLW